jgi:uncharacterized membrane protein
LFAADVLKVLYAPHKVFKQIVQNPKYWGPLLVLLIFTGVQTGLYYAQYSKTYYEVTQPAIGQLTAWTDNTSLWRTNPTASVGINVVDIMNTTFYGNTSLQFDLANSSSVSMSISNLNGSVNCSPTSFQNLYLQIKIVQPTAVPSSASLRLFSGASNYFQTDLTSALSNETSPIWNNLTIPVGSGNWQRTGSPSWSSITGMNLTLSFPETSNVTVRIGGLFFRGFYQTPVEIYGAGGFTASVVFSGLFTFIIQWLSLSVVFFLIIKLMKGPVTWKPVFISIAFTLVTMVVQTLIILVTTATLPAQIHYPFEFAYGFQVTYNPQIVALFSTASQAIYNSLIAPELTTLTLVTTIVVVATYVWITLIGSTIVRAITEFSWTKSLLTSAAGVVLTFVILSLLSAFGIV